MNMKSPAQKTKSVVIIEDQTAIRELVTEMLEGKGKFKVIGSTADGAEGVELALRLKPDILILDILLPGITGIEVLHRLRNTLPELRVLVFSGKSEKQLARGLLKEGVEAQTEQVCRNIIAILEANGMGLKDLVKVNSYIINPSDLAGFRAARTRVFGDAKPASTLAVIQALAGPQYLVEIEAIAAKIARIVVSRSPPSDEKYASGVSTRFEVVDPRWYITTALACAWLNPCRSRSRSICSWYFESPRSASSCRKYATGWPCFFSIAGKCADRSPDFAGMVRP